MVTQKQVERAMQKSITAMKEAREAEESFEYNIYGCPEGMDVRIGNFVQSKLEVN